MFQNPLRKIIQFKTATLLAAAVSLLMIAASANPNADWTSAGQGQTNWSYQPLEKNISNRNAAKLNVAWANAGGDVSATPSVSGGVVYYPDFNGNLFAVDATTGDVIWQDNLATISGIPGAFSRTTPTIDGNVLYVGLQNQGELLAISRNKGALIWMSQLDTHAAAVITQSPADYKGVLYVGMSSQEESFATDPSYTCCSFRGSLSAVDEKTGNVLWKTYTAPVGYSGNAVWGSTPVVDPSRMLVYITTGNNYTVPADVAAGNSPLDPADYVDSILALDLRSGAVVWVAPHLGVTADAWTVACLIDKTTANCPDPAGPDFDFGQGVMEVTRTVNGQSQDLVIAGQKSGKLWALDAGTGQVAWEYDSGVGYVLGGMEWGSATDGSTVYFANAYGGFWGAVDIATGKLKWQTADPNPVAAPWYANDIGPVSVANGVVYVGSLGGKDSANPTMFALDAATGEILWSYASGSGVGSSPAIVNGMVFWGTGYDRLSLGLPAGEHNFYAFTLK